MTERKLDSANPFPIVTLDGGAATGKSSTAKGVSRELQFLHVDTGSHYRALTYLLLERNVSPEESETITKTLNAIELSADIDGTLARLVANGDVLNPEYLRSAEVNRSVSSFAALPAVRDRLLRYQRWHLALARKENFQGLVMEGRDIGSIVFPEAPFRFFLEADEATRIRRRLDEGQQDSVMERDRADSERKNAPLLCPPGAIRINSGDYTLDEVVAKICHIVRQQSIPAH